MAGICCKSCDIFQKDLCGLDNILNTWHKLLPSSAQRLSRLYTVPTLQMKYASPESTLQESSKRGI
jgi:hypothetical protein